ncbi:3-keto-5-aminohexanoate cleavage protein [uncultured Shimia sp.]|uniref:3-keto-5-aminohexanoate cleavage protein n=1 Tax=uncultured Shimia sp. TaxID=573152 RepID=UPI0025DB636D|nr:3-keto-5-aminohexanoate cleavage protein [uncultured Shimia sp.]
MPKNSIKPQLGCEALVPLKVTVAPNGARKTKTDHPNLPVSIEDIAYTARQCSAAGAHELHLHIRDGKGQHTLDPARYREAISAVSEAAPDMQIQITTEAAGLFDVAEQFETLKQLVPSAASVSVREMARDDTVSRQLYAFAHEAGVSIQHILYDARDIAQYRAWLSDAAIASTQRDVLLVTGQYNPPKPAKVEELSPLLTALAGEMSSWTVCAFGESEQAVMQSVIRQGGHVRVGFENNVHRSDGQLLKDNAESVSGVVQCANRLGRSMLGKVQGQ